MTGPARFFVARHGETIFNAAARMQGEILHTPLTRRGFAQAEQMGLALRRRLGSRPRLDLWASSEGRALQTLAIIAEHLELDWHEARSDPRLGEIGIGEWSGLYYRDVTSKDDPIIDPATGLFSRRPPGGEWYDEVAERLRAWLEDTAGDPGDRLVVMHGMSSRVLRGMLTGAGHLPACGAPIAEGLPQGSVAEIAGGIETVVRRGGGTDAY